MSDMRWLLIALVLAGGLMLLAGCRADEAAQADRQVLCSQKGEAFYVQPGSMDVSFVIRTPTADKLCARMN